MKKPYEPWNYHKEEMLWRAEHSRKGLEEYCKNRDAKERARQGRLKAKYSPTSKGVA